jgi:hypothetical protein
LFFREVFACNIDFALEMAWRAARALEGERESRP